MAGSKVPRDENMTPEVRRFLDGLSRDASATMPTSTVKGNVSGADDTPSDLTTTELTTLINAFTQTLSGAVPAPNSASGKVLYDTGWGAAPVSKFSSEFISSQQTYANGGLVTTAHGLGSIPKLMEIVAVCTSTELGYAAGDTITVAASNVTLSADATNLYASVWTSGISTINKSTQASATLTAAKWQLVLSGWN